MKNYNYKSFVRRSMMYICRATQDGKSLTKIKEDLRKIVNSYVGLNRNERYDLYLTLLSTCRAVRNYPGGDWQKKLSHRDTYDTILKAARRNERSMKLRIKRGVTKALLSDPQQIFFLCSVHDKPADDHKMWQGLIYIDRFWRQKVSGDLYYAVLSYVKNRGIHTVQWVMHDPVWMTTRPNCKHYFIPLKTEEVLHSSPKALSERHRYKAYTVDDYFHLRSQVYAALDDIAPCSYFEKKMKEQG